MHRALFSSVVCTVALGWSGIAARGNPVSAIQFPDGTVLNVLGTVGSGPNTAYLDIDFSNNAPAGPAFAWQYKWTGTALEADMLNAVAAADSNLAVIADPVYGIGFIDNFNYAGNVGAAVPFPTGTAPYSFWSSYIGSYDSADSSNSATQNINWVFAPSGADALTLGDQYDDSGNLLNSGVENLLYGWTINGEFQTTNLTPILPEVSVPEPATLGLVAAAGIGLLARRRRR